MDQMKLTLSVEENGNSRSLQVQIVSVGECQHKPTITAEDTISGFKTVTELPTKDYSKLIKNLSKVATKDSSEIAKTLLRLFSLIGGGFV